jgi:hypothetical protein
MDNSLERSADETKYLFTRKFPVKITGKPKILKNTFLFKNVTEQQTKIKIKTYLCLITRVVTFVLQRCTEVHVQSRSIQIPNTKVFGENPL